MKKIDAELFAARYLKFNCNGVRALRPGPQGLPRCAMDDDVAIVEDC
jgi:hypothetical protein